MQKRKMPQRAAKKVNFKSEEKEVIEIDSSDAVKTVDPAVREQEFAKACENAKNPILEDDQEYPTLESIDFSQDQ